MCPAFDVGTGGLVLCVQRIELLVESVVGRDPRIDRTADRLDRSSLHGRASIPDRASFAIQRDSENAVPTGFCSLALTVSSLDPALVMQVSQSADALGISRAGTFHHACKDWQKHSSAAARLEHPCAY